MAENPQVGYQEAVASAHRAAMRGDRVQAVYWAELVVKLAPDREEAWILLGDQSDLEERIKCYTKAVDANPRSQVARQRLSKALKEQRQQGPSLNPKVQLRVPFSNTIQRKTSIRGALVILTVVMFFCVAAWLGVSSLPALAEASTYLFPTPSPQMLLAVRDNMLTSTPTKTPTPTATFTPTPTATATPSPTWTPLPPTATPQVSYGRRPGYVGRNEFWVEVDIGEQLLIAHRGDDVLRTFSISSGKSSTPTVTGSFQVYNMINSQTMFGSDFYLPDVPYVLYFYKDFAIHGAYWHTNFGNPVSHGCINMIPGDAGWIYQAARIGTWVIIHY